MDAHLVAADCQQGALSEFNVEISDCFFFAYTIGKLLFTDI